MSRSDCIKDKIKDEVIFLLKTTKLSCTEIGKKFGVSRGPIWSIKNEAQISRANPRKNDPALCKWCAKAFRKINSKTRPNRFKYCSKECYRQWQMSDDNKGFKNPAWDPESKYHEEGLNKLRKTPEWKNWRISVYQRDNYTCMECRQRGKNLHPHHILYKSEYPDLIFNINNGITLCIDCHKKVHFYDTINKQEYREKFLKIMGALEASLMHY